MSTPISILLLGKNPGHMKAVSDVVKPEYEIIQTASTVDDALSLLPSLLSGSDGHRKISLAMMGGGFSPADFEKVLQVPGAKGIPWMRPDVSKTAGQMPTAEAVAGRVRECLDEHKDEIAGGKGDGEVWAF